MDTYIWIIRAISTTGFVLGLTLFAVAKLWMNKQADIWKYNRIMIISIAVFAGTFLLTLILRIIQMNIEVFG